MKLWSKLKWVLFNIEPSATEMALENLKNRKEEKIITFVDTKKCHYKKCKNKLIGFTYDCPYCFGVFCELHRLPETHDCKNPQLPRSMRKGYGVKQVRK